MIDSNARVHFIGIGGVGMSALAHVLLARGARVSGSDLHASEVTQRLAAMGATIHIGHDASNIEDADVVVASRAVPDLNVEIVAARYRGLPVHHRAELLAKILDEGFGIAVVGTHGKTTTAAMTTHVLTAGGLDPTALIGADVATLGGNVRLGAGRFLVAEVDESDGSLLYVRPQGVVLTSLDITDHRDYYHTVARLMDTFTRFLSSISPHGFAVMCIDHRHVRELVPRVQTRILTYGLSASAHFSGTIQALEGSRTRATFRRQGKLLGTVVLNVPGRYNVRNALAATAVALEVGLSFEQVAPALESFRGVSRRFAVRAEVDGIMVVDDYAHNPIKVAAVLRAAKESWPDRRVVAIFQPHRYTRTKTTHRRFALAFQDAAELIITGIYGADEEPMPGVSAELIIDAVRPHRLVTYIPDKTMIVERVLPMLRAGDLVLTMGAGDIWLVADAIADALRKRARDRESPESPESTGSRTA